MRHRTTTTRTHAALAAAVVVSLAGTARADRLEPAPKEVEGVHLDEKLGATLPAGLSFKDEQGRDVLLGDVLGKGKPTLLTLNYSDCPMLCSVQIQGLVDGLKNIAWTAGAEFQMVTISLNPKEQPERARATKQRYMASYNRPGSEDGWRFLVGSEQNVRAVADAIGFGYTYVTERGEYAHPPVVTLLSPSGAVSRYLYGLAYEPQTLRIALLEASEGRQVSTIEQLILYCFHYDAAAGRYAPVAKNIMRLGGAVFLVAFGFVLIGFFWRERRRHAALAKVPS